MNERLARQKAHSCFVAFRQAHPRHPAALTSREMAACELLCENNTWAVLTPEVHTGLPGKVLAGLSQSIPRTILIIKHLRHWGYLPGNALWLCSICRYKCGL